MSSRGGGTRREVAFLDPFLWADNGNEDESLQAKHTLEMSSLSEALSYCHLILTA